MAVLAVVQAWLAHPAGAVIRRQVSMVAAERWREQRVLLAAYTQCADKLHPTLRVATYTWTISPAGTDPYGMWGIHVDGPEAAQIALAWLAQTAGSVDLQLPAQAGRITDRLIASNRMRVATAEVLEAPPKPKPKADAAGGAPPSETSASSRRSAINAKTLPYGSGSMTNLSVANEAELTAEDTRRDRRQQALANLFAANAFDEQEAGVLLHLGRHGAIAASEVAQLVGTTAAEVWMNVLSRRLAVLRVHVMQRDDQDGSEPIWRWVG